MPQSLHGDAPDILLNATKLADLKRGLAIYR
jgi:hypothetical protein